MESSAYIRGLSASRSKSLRREGKGEQTARGSGRTRGERRETNLWRKWGMSRSKSSEDKEAICWMEGGKETKARKGGGGNREARSEKKPEEGEEAT